MNRIDAGVVPAGLRDAIRAARRIALAGHVTPDADCIGSIGGFCLGLRGMGKHVVTSMPPGSVSRKLTFLADSVPIAPASREEIAACDLLIAVDTAKAARVNLEGKLEAFPSLPVANVDHHATNVGFGRYNWVDGDRSSAAEMVYEVLAALDCRMTREIATLLYAGIHADTQGFSLPNTTPRSLDVAHELARAGVDIPHLCERLHRSFSKGEFELLRVIYGNTRVSEDGALAWSTVDCDEIRGAGCTAADIDDQVNVPRSIEGISIAILFSEGNRGKIRMNFRGERGTNVLALAQRFGGGGHHESAGAILDGTIADVSRRVLDEARVYLAGH